MSPLLPPSLGPTEVASTLVDEEKKAVGESLHSEKVSIIQTKEENKRDHGSSLLGKPPQPIPPEFGSSPRGRKKKQQPPPDKA